MSTQLTSPDQDTLAVELLQCQLLSLMGVAPDDQILLSSSGEVLFSPRKTAVATIPVAKLSRSRFFLFSSAGVAPEAPEMTSDWRQICTKSTFGSVAVSQPAFRKTSSNGSDAASTLICEPCARTCTTGLLSFLLDSGPVNPMEWDSSKAIASRFISEIVVIAGDVDVAPPPGFTKLPTDLNHSASGDYVYLCVKRGGPHALTQLHVLFQQRGEASSKPKEGSLLPERVLAVNCNSGGAAGDETGVDIRIGYDSVLRKSNLEQLEMLAITDIVVVIGDQPPPSPAYVKITRNLNEGSPHAQPIYLFYQLSPLNGFVCDSGREHSEFGECLFASRHLLGLTNVFDMDEQRLTTGLPALAAQRTCNDAAFMETQYRQRQPGMLGRLKGGLQRAQSYENKQMQAEALKRIPVDKLRERAHANPSPMPHYQDELVKQLLHWFKREFFTWMNQPRCSACNNEKTRSVRTEGPSTAEEIAGQAGRVEVYQCPVCNAFTRFPRYNNPAKLLDTRTGRCGEWANCFTLCCRSMGFEARYVLDVTDHVWTEVYSEHFKRWLHCDSCEDQLDCPLTYEVGWGKKLSYIFSFAHDEVVDTARRYTQNWVEMRSRRQDVSEQWLQTTIDQINRELWGQQPPERVAVLRARAQSEREELLRGRSVQSGEVKGRVSGSAEWKNQRSEDGKQAAVATNGEATAGSESQKIGDASESTSTAERLQQICRNLVVGCQKDCPNPYCLIGRTAATDLETSSDVNERAAQAIQVVTALNAKGFSSEALELLLCPANSRDLRWFMWKHHPCVYLPLQDSPAPIGSELLIDISGHGNHVENARHCALRKPFRIPNSTSSTVGEGRGDDGAFGLQLLQGQQLVVPVKLASPSTGCVLSFLLRLDQGVASEASQDGGTSVLTVRFCASESRDSIVFRVIWDPSKRQFACELQSQNGAPTSAICAGSLLAFGGYFHVAIVQEDSAIAAYVNGTEAVRVQAEATEAAASANENVIILEGTQPRNGERAERPSNAAVLSHLTVMSVLSPQEFADFCNTMKQDFVCAPPLRAFGPNGERNDRKCSEKAAGAQSGYRVARVLSTLHCKCSI
ncbi:hypothetical protein BBJ28_00009678 [Nothophytophthora sp. Chile5]|nr:hypothetical protein BBJ28_00009678 [Nothophytophthora sp. Chile5]